MFLDIQDVALTVAVLEAFAADLYAVFRAKEFDGFARVCAAAVLGDAGVRAGLGALKELLKDYIPVNSRAIFGRVLKVIRTSTYSILTSMKCLKYITCFVD